MEAAQLTQEDLAERLGHEPTEIALWLDGTTPSAQALPDLLTELRVSEEWLLSGTGAGPGKPAAEKRAEYEKASGWGFRAENADGTREYGNANIFSLPADVATLVREVLQNSMDAALGDDPVSVKFSLIELERGDRDSFLRALNWGDALRPHIAAAAGQDQHISRWLDAGLRRVEEQDHLMLLRIKERNTVGLLGSETGHGHFAALCRNSLDSHKSSGAAGGAFGLGKAVLWRMSGLSTVLFNSDLSQPHDGRWSNRLIGRAELPWHEVDGEGFAGPGFFGLLPPDSDAAQSYWENEVLADDLHLMRRVPSGTSILIPGFTDPSRDDDPDPEDLAARIEHAAAVNFWPAMTAGRLEVSVDVQRGREVTSEMEVLPARHRAASVAALEALREGRTTDSLEKAGDVVQRRITLTVPAKRDGTADETDHEALLLVRQAEPDSVGDDSLNTMARFRRPRMVVKEDEIASLGVGTRPFHAILLAGEAAGEGAADKAAEAFLRSSEPPAHEQWILTPDLKVRYAFGAGAHISRFLTAARQAVLELVTPPTKDLDEGPAELRKLLQIQGQPVPADKSPRLAIEGRVDGDVWVLEGRIRVEPAAGGWRMRPVPRFASDGGGGVAVRWSELAAVTGCDVDEATGEIHIEPGVRTADFRGRTDPDSHPTAAADGAVEVTLKAVERLEQLPEDET